MMKSKSSNVFVIPT